MSAFLAHAQQVLDGTGVVHHQRLRAACWLVRIELESTVRSLLEEQGVAVAGARMRSQLTCLEVLRHDVAADAHYAWSMLSQATHHHAYNLSPSLAEVRNLAQIVTDLSGLRGGGRAGVTWHSGSSPR
jgi:hypothetical protein